MEKVWLLITYVLTFVASIKKVDYIVINYISIRRLYKLYFRSIFAHKDDTSDQVYNPNKTRITKCDKAVNYIWDYYLVDADSKLFPGFHVANVKVSSYAAKNKGILSQEKAQSLASKSDYSWKKILKYFYTRKSGTSYYNKEVAVGSVSIVE